MHRHGSPQATAETYAREVLAIGPDDRCLSVAKLFFAYGLGNSLTFPLGGRRHGDPRTRAGRRRRTSPSSCAPSSRRCSSPAPASSPACSTPTSPESTRSPRCGRRSPPARRCRPTCSGASAPRFGHPVLDGIGTTEALHIFLSNTLGERAARARAASRCPGYEARLVDDAGDRRHRAPTRRATSTSAGRRSPPATGAATTRPRPRSRASGCAPATCTPARPTATGRSSAATAT